jgi:hypothetical protein
VNDDLGELLGLLLNGVVWMLGIAISMAVSLGGTVLEVYIAIRILRWLGAL